MFTHFEAGLVVEEVDKQLYVPMKDECVSRIVLERFDYLTNGRAKHNLIRLS